MKQMQALRNSVERFLRRLEPYIGTDMVYLVSGGFWINANTFAVTALSFLLSIEFAHYISKDVYGTYQFVLSIASLIGSLTLTGMNAAVTQAVARGYEGTYKKSVDVQIKWGLLPFAAGFLVSLYYLVHGNATLSLSFILVAILLPIWNACNTFGAFFQGRKDFRSNFLYNQIVNVSYYGVMFIALVFVPGATMLILANLLVNTLTTYLLYRASLKHSHPNTETDEQALSYGKHVSIMNGIASLASPIDNIVVYHFLGAAMLAVYAFASTIPERVSGMTKSITQLALPKFSAGDPSRIKETILKRTLQFMLVGLAIAIVYIIIAPFLFTMFFPQYKASIIYSEGYAIAAMLMYSSSLPQTALLAIKAKKQLYIYNIISPIVQIALLIILGALYGIWGVIIARGISGAILLALSLTFVLTI